MTAIGTPFQEYDDILGHRETPRHREEHASGKRARRGAAERRAKRLRASRLGLAVQADRVERLCVSVSSVACPNQYVGARTTRLSTAHSVRNSVICQESLQGFQLEVHGRSFGTTSRRAGSCRFPLNRGARLAQNGWARTLKARHVRVMAPVAHANKRSRGGRLKGGPHDGAPRQYTHHGPGASADVGGLAPALAGGICPASPRTRSAIAQDDQRTASEQPGRVRQEQSLCSCLGQGAFLGHGCRQRSRGLRELSFPRRC